MLCRYTLSSFRTDSASSQSLAPFETRLTLYVERIAWSSLDFDETPRKAVFFSSFDVYFFVVLRICVFRRNLSNRSEEEGWSPYFHPSSIGNAIISMKNKFQWDTPVGRNKVEVEKKEREDFFASYREISPSDLLVPPLNSRIASWDILFAFREKVYIYIFFLRFLI